MPISVRHSPSLPLLGRIAQIAGEGQYRADVLNPLAQEDARRKAETDLRLLSLQESARQSNQRIAASQLAQQAQLQQDALQKGYDRLARERMARFSRLAGLEQAQFKSAAQRQRDARLASINRAQEQIKFRNQLTRDQLGFDNRLLFQDQEFAQEEFSDQRDFREEQYSNYVQQARQQGFGFTPSQQKELDRLEAQLASVRSALNDGTITPREYRRQTEHVNEQRFQILPKTRQVTPQERFGQETFIFEDPNTGMKVPLQRDEKGKWTAIPNYPKQDLSPAEEPPHIKFAREEARKEFSRQMQAGGVTATVDIGEGATAEQVIAPVQPLPVIESNYIRAADPQYAMQLERSRAQTMQQQGQPPPPYDLSGQQFPQQPVQAPVPQQTPAPEQPVTQEQLADVGRQYQLILQRVRGNPQQEQAVRTIIEAEKMGIHTSDQAPPQMKPEMQRAEEIMVEIFMEMPKPKSRQEHASLTDGEVYMAPDGNIYQKR